MDYNEQLQQINAAKENGNIAELETIKQSIEAERETGPNMGNAMVLMAAEKALDKLSQMKKETVEIPDWRMDQINRTGGTSDEINRVTAEINQKTEKSVIQGWYNVIKQIPESMRSAEQQRAFKEYEEELGMISKKTEQTIRGVAADRVENARVAENLEKLDLNKISPVDAAMNETLGKYTDHMSSQIASGASLWDMPSDVEDDEPVSFTDRIQPSQTSVDESHKEYLKNEINTVEGAIGAGFGNEQALDRGIYLEKKLSEYDPFSQKIQSMTRANLGDLHAILAEQGNVGGYSPDQLYASIQLFLQGKSVVESIPDVYGLREKMTELKNDSTAAEQAATVEEPVAESEPEPAVTPDVVVPVQEDVAQPLVAAEPIAPVRFEMSPEMTDLEKSPMVLEKIRDAKTMEDLMEAISMVKVLHAGNKTIDTFIPKYMLGRYFAADFDENEITNIGGIRDKAIEIRMGVPAQASSFEVQSTLNQAAENLPGTQAFELDAMGNLLEDFTQEDQDTYRASVEKYGSLYNEIKDTREFKNAAAAVRREYNNALLLTGLKSGTDSEKDGWIIWNMTQQAYLASHPEEAGGQAFAHPFDLEQAETAATIADRRIGKDLIESIKKGDKQLLSNRVMQFPSYGRLIALANEGLTNGLSPDKLEELGRLLKEGYLGHAYTPKPATTTASVENVNTLGTIEPVVTTAQQQAPEEMFATPPPIPVQVVAPETAPVVPVDLPVSSVEDTTSIEGDSNDEHEMISDENNNEHEPVEIKLVSSVEKDIGFVPYQEYEKSFMYMDRGAGVDLSTSKDTSKLEGYEKSEMVFSYNPATGSVMPRKDAWRQATSNSSYYLGKTFKYDFNILDVPFDQLVFKPAKLNQKGELIEKGEIKVKGVAAMNMNIAA